MIPRISMYVTNDELLPDCSVLIELFVLNSERLEGNSLILVRAFHYHDRGFWEVNYIIILPD